MPRSVLDGYDDAVQASIKAVQNELKASLSLVDYSAPVEQIRTEVVALMDAYCGAASNVGARLSSEFYNGLREMVTGNTARLSLQSGRNPRATERAVRAFVQQLVDGDEDEAIGAFEDLLLERVEYEAKRAIAYNTIDNARLDPDQPRFARVPQGEKTCDFCLMLASRGPVYLTEESAGAFTKFHAHCVTGETTVSGNGLLAGLRRQYKGPLVRIVTRNGRELSVTPNHPILTTGGWVLAGDLKEGDSLICASFTNRHVVGVPNVQDVPPTAEEVFESCSLMDSSGFGGMPGTAEYFDGEIVTDCDIKIVDPCGLLKCARDSSFCEPINHGGLAATHANEPSFGFSLNRDSVDNFLFDGNYTTSDSIVGSPSLRGPSFGSHLGRSDNAGLTTTSNDNTGVGEHSSDGRSTDSSAVGNTQDALATLIRFNNPFRHRSLLAEGLDAIALKNAKDGSFSDAKFISNLTGTHLGEIEIDDIVLLGVSEASCHVYNLSTSGGWYVASGIVTHNCDCKVVPFWDTVTDGASRRRSIGMSVEGYDPDAYYEQYQAMMKDPHSTFANRMAKGAETAKARRKAERN